MNETWDSQTLAKNILEVMPKLSRMMVVHMTALTENEATMMQLAALHMLMNNNMTTSDLAKKRHVSLQAASTFVQGLVDRGWVTRVEDRNDRRRSILQVTEVGREQEKTLRVQMTEHLSSLADDLSTEEIAAAQVFLAGLHRIVQQYNRDDLYQENGE